MDAQRMGSFIAQRRKELKLTQAELAEKLHVTDKAVSRWERGVGLPDINMIEPLALALDVSLVELVQAKHTEQSNISLSEAEQIVTDTIKLSKSDKAVKAVGATILCTFGVVCILLLCLLISDGSIILYSVFSLIAGLIAWGAPIWQMTLARSSKASVSGFVSFAAAVTALTVQFFQLAHEVETGDFAAIEDTIHALCHVVALFGVATLLLNMLMIWRSKAK